jgi:hypothetical protein
VWLNMTLIASYFACGLTFLIASAESALFFGALGYFLLEQKLKSHRQVANIIVLAGLCFASDKISDFCGRSRLIQNCIDLACLERTNLIFDVFFSVTVVAFGYLFAKFYLNRNECEK